MHPEVLDEEVAFLLIGPGRHDRAWLLPLPD